MRIADHRPLLVHTDIDHLSPIEGGRGAERVGGERKARGSETRWAVMSSARAAAYPNPSASYLRRPLSERDGGPARSTTAVPATVIHKTATSARRRWQAARLIGQRYTEAYVRTPGRSGPRVVHPTTATTTARATCAAPAAVLRRDVGGRVVVDLARVGQVAVHRARLVEVVG